MQGCRTKGESGIRIETLKSSSKLPWPSSSVHGYLHSFQPQINVFSFQIQRQKNHTSLGKWMAQTFAQR